MIIYHKNMTVEEQISAIKNEVCGEIHAVAQILRCGIIPSEEVKITMVNHTPYALVFLIHRDISLSRCIKEQHYLRWEL